MKFRFFVIAAITGILLFLSGCSTTIRTGNPPSPEEVVTTKRDHPAHLGIPPGHLPPPGNCRVWFPGRPPGQQPRPTNCNDALASAPPDSWVLYRPTRDRRNIHVRIIDSRRRSAVVEVLIYNAENGRYVKSVEP